MGGGSRLAYSGGSGRRTRIDFDHVIESTVFQASVLIPASLNDLGDFDELDEGRLPGWVESLRESESALRQLRLQLEARLVPEGRRCAVCGEPIAGRTDRAYCGATCRQRARRASRV